MYVQNAHINFDDEHAMIPLGYERPLAVSGSARTRQAGLVLQSSQGDGRSQSADKKSILFQLDAGNQTNDNHSHS
jgi:hypothetical protein